MDKKLNPLDGEIDLLGDTVSDIIRKLNPLTGRLELVYKADSYIQKINPFIGDFDMVGGTGASYIIKEATGNGYINLTNAVANHLMELKVYGGIEQRNLPAGYTQLDGITGDGNAYIDLNMQLTEDDEADIYFTKPSSLASSNVFGGRTGAGQNNMSVIIAGTGNAVLDFNNSDYTDYRLNTAISLNTTYKAVLNKSGRYIYQGDTLIDSNTTACTDTIETPGTYLFHLAGSGLTSKFAGTINRVVIKGKKDLLPCKDSNNVVGMYDIINGVFYTNANETGSFTAGNTAVPTPITPMDIVSNNGVIKAKHQSGLPLGYTLLDYITFDGQSYIDTGYTVSLDDEIQTKVKFTVNGFIYGASTSNPRVTLYGSPGGNQRWGNKYVSANGVPPYTTDLVIKHNKDAFIVNDTTMAYDSQEDFTTAETLTIGNDNGNTTTNLFSGDLYYFKFFKNGVLVRDYIPVKDSNNTVGLFDMVSGTFFTNDGTGTLTAGNTVSDPMTVYIDGITETIWSHTKNLFSGTVEQGGLGDSSGAESQSSARIRSTAVPVKPNTQYYLSWTTNSEMAVNIRNAHFYDASGTWLSRVNAFTFTTPPNTAFVRFVWQHSDANTDIIPSDISNIQLELGNTATTYVPYYDGGTATAEMLLAIGDTKDEQEILSGNITRKVGIKVLDGTESWSVASTNVLQADAFDVATTQPSLNGYCTALIFTSSSTLSGMPENSFRLGSSVYPRRLYVKSSTYATDTTTWKQYLKDQYDNGTPVMVLYSLATATTETVTGQTMNIPEGYSTIEITQASIDNLGLYAKYKATA